MISDDEKAKIKEEIVTKVNSVLEKNNESYRIDKVNILIEQPRLMEGEDS